MQYTTSYLSPLGPILLAADALGLTGLWFQGQKHYARSLAKMSIAQETPVLLAAKQWLDLYFSGKVPDFCVPVHFLGTPFQQDIWQLLLKIPYGATTTYGTLAKQYAAKYGLHGMSAQAVGNAVSKNPVSILVPCHRVLGAQGQMTGYAGGTDRKLWLLQLEGAIHS